MSDGRAPDLSVVVVSLGNAASLFAMVDALASSTVDLEIIIPATARVARLLETRAALPASVRVVSLDDVDEDAWRMRARGVAAAGAPVVATLEDHALPATDWARRVIDAHATLPHAAIGGVVEKATPDTGSGWAMYFLDYGRYIPPQAAGPREYLSACNVSYKRAALADIAETWRVAMHETTVHFALLARGATLWLDPSIVVRQRRSLAIPEGMEELRHHGTLFGQDRAGQLSAAGRAVRFAATPLVPAVHLARAARHAVGSPRLALGFVRAVPALVAFAVAWAAGEGAGLWRGRRA
jgi:hypothetical protein